MRGNVISSSFRRIAHGHLYKPQAPMPSAASKRFGYSRRGVTTSEDIRKLKQEEWICPIKYFREEIKFLESLDGNKLLDAVGVPSWKTLATWKAGKTIRSLPELIAKHHARGDALGSALRLDNLRISRAEGKFGFIDKSGIGPPEKAGSLKNDWRLGGDVLAAIAERVLGNTPWPKDLNRYVKLMRSASAKNFRQLFYNSLFLSPRARYWLRVFMDQRCRKDGQSLPRRTKKKVQELLLAKLRYKYGGPEVEGSLLWIAKKNEVVAGAMAEARIEAQMRRKREEKKRKEKEMTEIDKNAELKWRLDTARWVVCVNRDVLTHGTQTKPEYRDKVKFSMLTAENIRQMLQLEFEDLDQNYIDLCAEDDVLWEFLGIWEIFFEDPDTWDSALEALQRDLDRAQALGATN